MTYDLKDFVVALRLLADETERLMSDGISKLSLSDVEGEAPVAHIDVGPDGAFPPIRGPKPGSDEHRNGLRRWIQIPRYGRNVRGIDQQWFRGELRWRAKIQVGIDGGRRGFLLYRYFVSLEEAKLAVDQALFDWTWQSRKHRRVWLHFPERTDEYCSGKWRGLVTVSRTCNTVHPNVRFEAAR